MHFSVSQIGIPNASPKQEACSCKPLDGTYIETYEQDPLSAFSSSLFYTTATLCVPPRWPDSTHGSFWL